jgi:acetyl-CoA carboxylase biotin carboxyl carrier protein
MASAASSSGGPFDLDQLQRLIEMMEQHELNEVRLQRGDERITLRRGIVEECGHMLPMQHVSPGAMPLPPAALPPAPPAAAPAPAASTAEPAGLVLKSPTIGTFYQSASPGEPPFVKVGDRIKPETVVCLIEAMKVFNPIPAKMSGVIAKVLVSDGDAVDFNQPLFLLTE